MGVNTSLFSIEGNHLLFLISLLLLSCDSKHKTGQQTGISDTSVSDGDFCI